LGCDKRRADNLVELFHKAAMFLADKIENEGWKWRSNYLREHVGCAYGAEFTNTLSPYVLELMFRQYPDLRKYESPELDLPF
jgi:hypothetical protein